MQEKTLDDYCIDKALAKRMRKAGKLTPAELERYVWLEPRVVDRLRALRGPGETMPTINLTADELAAVAAALRRLIEDDKFPHAPRLDPLRAALAKLDAAAPEPEPPPKTPPPAKADKRARKS